MTAEEIVLQMELELIENIGKAVGSGKVGAADWYIQKMADIGKLNQQNQRIVQRYIDQIDPAMADEIGGALQTRLNSLDVAFHSAGFESVGVVADNAINDLILAYSASTAGTANRIGLNMLGSSSQAYTDILTKTQNKVLAGISTPQEALRETLVKWSEKGIPALTDKAGRQWQPDSYVNMQIRTAQTAGYTEMTMERNQQYGNDLIEVDSHIGARPKCEPWQAGVYSLSGADNKFPALSSTSYGDPGGLFGNNCRHNMYPYFPGISEKTYSPFPKKQNERAYENSQKQRYLERQIRSAKRGVSAAESAGLDTTKEKEKLRARQGNMRSFIEETGRTRQRSKEQV